MSDIAELRQKSVTALAYPSIVLLSTLAATAIILTYIVPQFEPLFAGKEEQLPLLTRGIFLASDWLRSSTSLIIMAGIFIAALVAILARSDWFRDWLHRHRRWIPGVDLFNRAIAGQLCLILSSLIYGGITVRHSLPLARETIGNTAWRAHLSNAANEIDEGSQLSTILARRGLMPATAVRLIEVGERSGALAQALEQAGRIISENVLSQLNRIVALLNPIAILILGLVVALLIGGVMLGVFSLGELAVS